MAPTCKARIPDHMLMCFTHWSMVPLSLQSAVYAGWRGMQPKTTLENHRVWRDAAEAAKKAVSERMVNHGV